LSVKTRGQKRGEKMARERFCGGRGGRGFGRQEGDLGGVVAVGERIFFGGKVGGTE